MEKEKEEKPRSRLKEDALILLESMKKSIEALRKALKKVG
jgi:hypothetical protein